MLKYTGPVPEQYTQENFLFEPLTPSHVQMDYEAVMSSQALLRLWSVSDWPQANFSVEDNLLDLEWHYDEHTRRIAFTYTILDQGKNRCLGCIYIKPASSLPNLTKTELLQIKPTDMICSFWVRASIIKTPLEEEIFQSMLTWFSETWQKPDIFFSSNPGVPHQSTLYEKNGLQLRLSLSRPNRYQYLWQVNGR